MKSSVATGKVRTKLSKLMIDNIRTIMSRPPCQQLWHRSPPPPPPRALNYMPSYRKRVPTRYLCQQFLHFRRHRKECVNVRRELCGRVPCLKASVMQRVTCHFLHHIPRNVARDWRKLPHMQVGSGRLHCTSTVLDRENSTVVASGLRGRMLV